MHIGMTKQKILFHIGEQASYGYGIAKKLDIPVSTVYGHLKDLHKREIISRKRKNSDRQIYYTLTEKGERLITVLREH